MSVITTVFDTETTGLPTDWKSDHTHPGWPEIVQFGMVVFDDRYPVFELGCLLSNPAMEIEQEAQNVHGIDVSMLMKWGIDRGETLHRVVDWMEKSNRLVAHNAGFDKKVLKAGIHRNPRVLPDPFMGRPTLCTMKSSMAICKIPGNHGTYKWPKLSEAYASIVDKSGFQDAHNALADVWACARILFKLEDGGVKLQEV